MQLLGQIVKHIYFGEGIITDISSKIVTIHFPQGDKKFPYPEAFSHFLTLKDTLKQKEINAKYNRQLQIEEAQKKKAYKEQERRKQLHNMKITPNSQAAFNIALNDANKIIQSGSISTGYYLSGCSKGKPRIPTRLKPNSVCLLTGYPQNGTEKERRILGAFMVNDDFCGQWCKNGIVTSHDNYKICLPYDTNLSYWNYFEHNESFPRWGNVAFKYFSNKTMHKILIDMTEILSGTEQESVMNEFYHYFCNINHL